MTRDEAYRQYMYEKYLAEGGQPQPQQPQQDYGAGTVAKDLGLEGAASGIGYGIETTAQINPVVRVMSGLETLARTGKAMYDAPEGESLNALWGSMFEPSTPEKLAQQTSSEAQQLIRSGQEIPEGWSPAFDFSKTAVKHSVPAAMSMIGSPLKSALTAAIGTGIGAATGKELFDDTGEFVGGLVGGVTPDIFRGIINKTAQAVRSTLGKQTFDVNNLSNNDIRAGIERLLSQAYPEGVPIDDPAAYQKAIDEMVQAVKVKVAAGEKGTVGQLTGDEGILAYEKLSGKESRPLQAKMDMQNAAIQREAEHPFNEIAQTGDEARALDVPQIALAERGEALKIPREDLNRQLLQQAAPEGVQVTKSGHEGFRQVREAVKQQYDDAWSKAGEMRQDAADAIISQVKEFKGDFSEAEAGVLNGIKSNVEKLREDGSPTQLAALDRVITEQLNRKSNSPPLAKELRYLRDKLLRASLPEESRTLLQQADANYPKFLVVQTATSKAMDKGGVFTGNEFKRGVEKVGGETRLAEGRAPLQKEYMDLAELERDFTEGAKTLGKSALSKFAKRESNVKDAYAAAQEMFKSKYTVSDLKEILDTTAGNPQAREDLRRLFLKDLHNTVSNKDKMLTRKGYELFKSRKDIYEKSGLFTKDELQRIDDGFVEGQKLFMHKEARNLGKLPAEKRRAMEAVSALVGAKIGAMAFGSPLIGAALGRKYSTEKYREFTSDRAEKLAYELTANPEKFVDLVDKAQDLRTQAQFNDWLLNMMRRAHAGAYATGEED